MFVYSIVYVILCLSCILFTVYCFHKRRKESIYTYNCYNNEDNQLNISICFTLVMLFFTALFYGIYHKSITHKEVRNFYITKVTHQERYSKKIVYYVNQYAGKDSNGKSKYRRVRKTRTDYFGPYFKSYSNNGNEYVITEHEYNKWKNIWGEKYIKTIKGSSTFLVKPIDGKYYESYYDGNIDNLYPKPEIHSYKNVLRNSNSVFGYKYGDGICHPVDKGNVNGVISEISLTEKEVGILANFNAYHGGLHQLHIITLVTKNKANNMLQMINKWGGLNKNELAVFIGVDETKNIIWIDAHSWMDNTKCQNEIRDGILKLKSFDAKAITKVYLDNLKYWKRKEFKDYDYINVKTPTSCKIVFCLSLISFVTFGFFILKGFVKK